MVYLNLRITIMMMNLTAIEFPDVLYNYKGISIIPTGEDPHFIQTTEWFQRLPIQIYWLLIVFGDYYLILLFLLASEGNKLDNDHGEDILPLYYLIKLNISKYRNRKLEQ